MKKFLSAVIVLVFITTFTNSCKKKDSNPVDSNDNNQVVLNAEQKILTHSINEFAFNLFEEIEKKTPVNENVFFSPFSINTVMYMLLNGANGKNKAELMEALELENRHLPRLNENHKAIYDAITKNQKSENIFLANSMWIMEKYPVLENYQNTLKKYYYSEVYERDLLAPSFIPEINDWISNHTGNMIKDMLKGLPPNPILLLANAIYFKDKWKLGFDVASTQKDVFNNLDNTTSEIEMMSMQDSTLRSYKDRDVMVLELPYQQSKTKMLLITTNNSNKLEELVDDFDEELLYKINANLKARDTRLFLPKFNLKTSIELNPMLVELGIKEAFKMNADFSGISSLNNLFLSSVLHDAAIEVDEAGTKAAAATVAIVTTRAAAEQPFIMYLNKPFLFIIMDDSTNSVLFIGKVNKL